MVLGYTMSLGVCIVVLVLQLLHLKRYFPQEKAYLDGASVDLILK